MKFNKFLVQNELKYPRLDNPLKLLQLKAEEKLFSTRGESSYVFKWQWFTWCHHMWRQKKSFQTRIPFFVKVYSKNKDKLKTFHIVALKKKL